MLILSHRGYHADVPENTLEAFERAIALGVDGIETDLRVSADGLTVLHHDRLAANGRPVEEHTRAQLSQMAGHHVPTIEEALERAPSDLLWNLELKTPAAVAPALALIRRHGASRRFLVTSFWHQAVQAVAEATTTPCGLLVCHRPDDLDAAPIVPPALRRRIEAIVWAFEFCDEATLAAARHQGLRNYVYSAHTPEDHAALWAWQADAVITDWPQRAQRQLGARGGAGG